MLIVFYRIFSTILQYCEFGCLLILFLVFYMCFFSHAQALISSLSGAADTFNNMSIWRVQWPTKIFDLFDRNHSNIVTISMILLPPYTIKIEIAAIIKQCECELGE